MVRTPKARGGIGIKDPTLMNLALLSNLLWWLITGIYDWWKKIHIKIAMWGIKKQ